MRRGSAWAGQTTAPGTFTRPQEPGDQSVLDVVHAGHGRCDALAEADRGDLSGQTADPERTSQSRLRIHA